MIKKYYIIAFLLIIADQASKLAVKSFDFFGISHEGMKYGELIPVIDDIFMLTYIENPGMAFGISFGSGKIFLSLFSIIAGSALGYYLYKIKEAHATVKTGIMLIFAGAVGNLIDRVFYGVIFNESPLFYGRVVDFLQVDIPDVSIFGLHYTHWPVFNIADSCVTVGVVILIIFHKKLPEFSDIFGSKKKNEPDNNEALENE